jgi:hypothetical protein
MRGLVVALGMMVGVAVFAQDQADKDQRVSVGRDDRSDNPAPARGKSAHDRAMGEPPVDSVSGAPTCEVDQLSLLAHIRMTPSRSGAILKISAKDPKQAKTVQDLAQMLEQCIQASNKNPATHEAGPSAGP